MKFCHCDGMETDQKNLQDLSTKNISFDHETECLTMKLEQVLKMKIVDNFVHCGMPYILSPGLGTRQVQNRNEAEPAQPQTMDLFF